MVELPKGLSLLPFIIKPVCAGVSNTRPGTWTNATLSDGQRTDRGTSFGGGSIMVWGRKCKIEFSDHIQNVEVDRPAEFLISSHPH